MKNYGNTGIPKQLKFFQQMCSYRTLIYYGTMEKKLWYVTMEQIWYYTKNYEILIYYGKNYGTIKNHGNIINQILL